MSGVSGADVADTPEIRNPTSEIVSSGPQDLPIDDNHRNPAVSGAQPDPLPVVLSRRRFGYLNIACAFRVALVHGLGPAIVGARLFADLLCRRQFTREHIDSPAREVGGMNS